MTAKLGRGASSLQVGTERGRGVFSGTWKRYAKAHCAARNSLLAANWTELERREVTVADGRRALAPYVGPVLVRFENRPCFTGAFVLGEGVLLGSIRWKTWTWW